MHLLQDQLSAGGEDNVAPQRCQHHPPDRCLLNGRATVHRARIPQIRRSQAIPPAAYCRRNDRRKTKQRRHTEVLPMFQRQAVPYFTNLYSPQSICVLIWKRFRTGDSLRASHFGGENNSRKRSFFIRHIN
jgi:hypothetical protein